MEISIDAFPSIKTNPPKVGRRLLNHVSPTDAIGNAHFWLHKQAKSLSLGQKSQVSGQEPA